MKADVFENYVIISCWQVQFLWGHLALKTFVANAICHPLQIGMLDFIARHVKP